MNDTSFPPATPPSDRAKYRQFLIDHGLDPNFNDEALRDQYEKLSESERAQVERDFATFLAS